MRLMLKHIADHEQRAKAAASIVAIGLHRKQSHVALAAAQTAARATLLAWGMSPHRFFSHPDVSVLVEVAAARRSDFRARPNQRLNLARDLLMAMHRILPALHEPSLPAARKRAARTLLSADPWAAFMAGTLPKRDRVPQASGTGLSGGSSERPPTRLRSGPRDALAGGPHS